MADKDGVIYLETDEDITSAIDKLNRADSPSVQIVTPKRSTLLQSVINMKLIQKAARDAKKQLVVVTTDPLATNIAARIGLLVARQVGEKAAVPVDAAVAAVADDEIEEADTPVDAVPEAVEADAVAAAEPAPPEAPSEPEPVEKPAKPKPTPAAKNKRVPNFGKMQKRVFWVIGGVLVLLLLVALNFYFTTAHVNLFAQATKINAAFDITASTSTQQSDPSSGTLAATELTEDKTLSTTVPATGTKDEGTKASGSMTVSNCYDNQPHTLVAGTRFASPGGKIFRSTSDVTVPGGTGSFFGCTTPGQATVSVTADQNGDTYNLGSGTKYTIPALSAAQQAGIYGSGGQMSGGTTKTAQVLTQSDIDKSQADQLNQDKSNAMKDLKGKAKGQVVIEASFASKIGSVTSDPPVGGETPQAKVTVQVSYTELAVDKADLSAAAKAAETSQVGNDSQIYDDGSGNASFTPGKGDGVFHVATAAYYGPKIDTAALAKQLKGKRYGDANDTASRVPGVQRSEISLSPGWATGMPLIASHIHIDIKPTKTSD
jgi:hypothetical protein